MIYVLDTGYSGPFDDVFSDGEDTVGHGTLMINLIKCIDAKAKITSVKIALSTNVEEMALSFKLIDERVSKDDFVVIPWVCQRNAFIDESVVAFAHKCNVIMAAGNFSSDVRAFSPAGCGAGTVVVALNKSLQKSSSSNFSNDLKTDFMFGTNITTIDKLGKKTIVFGTSAASCIYAALKNRSAKFKNRQRAYDRFFEVLKLKFQKELMHV